MKTHTLTEFEKDEIDNKKKEENLANYPYRYEDRHGKRWINPQERCSWDKLRKRC